ncbi:hypothetical protein [Synechococcus sp. RSCCF101]|nr:hypothetical protein [Synechococcus sp. RSCCF101]
MAADGGPLERRIVPEAVRHAKGFTGLQVALDLAELNRCFRWIDGAEAEG